ncbi:MAG: outer membrane protein assembly factor BamA [Planctomycetaceae bacterium]|nr:outer membrane protein assembly factor BamA [Planctomycetaceae bacterium]
MPMKTGSSLICVILAFVALMATAANAQDDYYGGSPDGMYPGSGAVAGDGGASGFSADPFLDPFADDVAAPASGGYSPFDSGDAIPGSVPSFGGGAPSFNDGYDDSAYGDDQYDDYDDDEYGYDDRAGPGLDDDADYDDDDTSYLDEFRTEPRLADIDGPDAEGNMVTAIEVLNTVTTTPDQIIYRMSTRVGYPLRERTLDGDFQRLTAMGVFDDIQIRKEMVQGGVKIIIVVREKDIIRRIEFTGNQQVKTRKLNTLIESKVGERFDAGRANRDRRAIEDFLHKEYYYFGEVEVDVQPFEDGVRLVYDLSEGGRLYVGDITFRGNSVFTDKELFAKMETKRSGLISRGKYLRRAFERDLERIRMSYLDKGYLDVRVIERPMQITANVSKSRWQRRDVFLHVDIDEGDQYHVGSVNIEFASTGLVSEPSIRAAIRTMPGTVYSPITIQEDAMKIRDVYGMAPNSRYFTRVIPEPEVTEDGLVMDVTFHISESPEVIIEGVRVTGLTHTKEVVVLREFELFPGEKIDSRKFQRTRENVENLAYFKDRPNIEIREGSAPDRAILVAELEETSTGKITAGVGVSSQDSIVGSFGISQRNFDYRDKPKSLRDLYTGKSFRGAGQSFSLNASVGSESQSYSANFTNPWIFGKPISMTMSAYYNNYEYDDEYHERRIGLSLLYGKRLFDIKELTVNAGYRFEMVNLSKFDNSYSYEYKRQEGNHNVSRWLAGLNYDSRDSSWEPTKGAQLSANVELAGKYALSSKDFWRAFLSTQYFIPFFVDSQERNWSLGFRGDAAYANSYGDGDGKSTHPDTGEVLDFTNQVPYYERFHLGGVGSVRGFDYRGITPRDDYDNAIGGEAMLSASVELFFPIWERIVRGSMFYDIGTVWRYGDDPKYNKGVDKVMQNENLSSTERKFRSSAGFGLHIKTPLGPMPVRLYYAIPMNKQKEDEVQRFQFTMGALF